MINLDSGQPVEISFALDVSSDLMQPTEAIWRALAPLPDGRYRATLAAGMITDAYGNTIDEDFMLDFFVLAGDADRSGIVDADDYFRIDLGFALGLTGFTNGDFDYSGMVDADDYFLIDSNFARGGLPAASQRRLRAAHHALLH